MEPGEDQETNPGRYGRHVAEWLAAKLRERGYDIESVIPEDWGWCVACQSGPDRVLAACGNVDVERPSGASEPPAPSEATWHCFPVAASSMWRRLLRRREVALALKRFDGELRAVLEAEPGIVLMDEP